MPYSVTMARAMSVAFSMSFWAPVVGSVKMSSSAVRPPMSTASSSRSSTARHDVLVLERERQRPTERATAGHDRHLVHGIGVRQHVTDERVAALVVGDDQLLLLGHHAGLALGAGDHTIDRLLELGHPDVLLVVPRREQRGLVHEIGEVGAGESRRAPGENAEVDRSGERLVLGVDGEDLLASLEVGAVDDDLAVEAARAQERGVEDVGTVGGGDEDHAGLDVEAVHLDEQLIEGLLSLVVSTAETGAAMAADGVDLVHEDDGRCRGFRLLEQVADADWRRRRRTSRRSPNLRSRRTGRPPRRPRRGRATSCRFRAGRRAEPPWGSWPPWPGTWPVTRGTP